MGAGWSTMETFTRVHTDSGSVEMHLVSSSVCQIIRDEDVKNHTVPKMKLMDVIEIQNSDVL